MADTGTTRQFGNMLNQKPVKAGAPAKGGKKPSSAAKSPWMGMKKSPRKGC